jgi:hypothetical protein
MRRQILLPWTMMVNSINNKLRMEDVWLDE